MELTSTRIPTHLTQLHRDAWKSLIAFLGAPEIASLSATLNNSLLACLFSSRCITKLTLRPQDFDSKRFQLRMLLHNLTNLEKLELVTPLPYFIPTLRSLLSRTLLKELAITGRIAIASDDEEHQLTVANLCPSIETLRIPLFLDMRVENRGIGDSFRFPPTLTRYAGPSSCDHLSMFPPTITELEIAFKLATPYATTFASTLATLSTFKQLSILRLHPTDDGELLPNGRPQNLDSTPFDFPCLTELLLITHFKYKLRTINAPLLHTFIISCLNPTALLAAMPSTVTHLTIRIISPNVPIESLKHLPPGLKTLRLFIDQSVTTGLLHEWFSTLPIGLEELVAPPSFIDWDALPPRLERLLCLYFDPKPTELTRSFWELRSLFAQTQEDPNHSAPILTKPLPASLTTIIANHLPKPIDFLPKTLRIVSIPSSTSFNFAKLETFVQHFPSLVSFHLGKPIAMPPPINALSSFDIVTYPQQLIAERFPSLPPNALDVKWHAPVSGFLLPTTLNTLILRRRPFESPAPTDAIEDSLLHPTCLDTMMKQNLHRLPNLTHLDIQVPHTGSIVPYLSSLPKLQILRLKNASFPLSVLPRDLKALSLPLDSSEYMFAPTVLLKPTPFGFGSKRTPPTSGAPSSTFGAQRLSTTVSSSPTLITPVGPTPKVETQSSSTNYEAFVAGTFGKKTAFSSVFSSIPSDPVISEASQAKLEFKWSDLPASLTEIDFTGSTKPSGGMFTFGASSIEHWPKGLTALSIATDGSWRDADVLALKTRLPNLKRIRLFGSICVTTIPIDLSSHQSASPDEGLSKPAPAPLDLMTKELATESLKPLIQSQFLRQGVTMDAYTLNLTLISTLPSGITTIDLLNMKPINPSLAPLNIPSNISTLRLSLGHPVSFGLKPLERTQMISLPPGLTDLVLISPPPAKIEDQLCYLPKTLKYLHVAPCTTELGTPVDCSTELLSNLPLTLITMFWPNFTLVPSDSHLLPPGIQLLNFGGGNQWTDSEFVALRRRLALAYQSSPSEAFVDPSLDCHLLKVPVAHKNFFSSATSAPLHLICGKGSISGCFLPQESKHDYLSIPRATSLSLASEGICVQIWNTCLPTLELSHPEEVISLNLGPPASRMTLRVDSHLDIPSLPQMVTLLDLTLACAKFDGSLLEILPSSLQSLIVHGPFVVDWSLVEWSKFPRNLRVLKIQQDSVQSSQPLLRPKTANPPVFEVTNLPPTLELLFTPDLAISPSSICNLPSSITRLSTLNNVLAAVRKEWQIRGLDPQKIKSATY